MMNFLYSERKKMADKEKKDVKVNGQVTGESVKAIAESISIGGLPDDACKYLADDVTYRLQLIAQVSQQHGFSMYVFSLS